MTARADQPEWRNLPCPAEYLPEAAGTGFAAFPRYRPHRADLNVRRDAPGRPPVKASSRIPAGASGRSLLVWRPHTLSLVSPDRPRLAWTGKPTGEHP
jgi:hypothetical protein